MTEPNLSVSNKSWNPANKRFWGTNPEKRLRKANILFITAIIGILISFFMVSPFGWLFGYSLWWFSYTDQWPLFHAFFLLLAVKIKTRPGPYFRAFLAILLIWSALKVFLFLLMLLENYTYGYDYGYYYIFGGFMSGVIAMPAMTFLIWKQTQKKKHYGPRAKTFLKIASVILIIRVISDIFFIWRGVGFDPIFFVINTSPLLFWISFTLLYVYRTEIEPWKETINPLNHVIPKEPYSGTIDTYTAGKLLEAKELLDKGTITMDEFLEIKGEQLGSKDEPTYVLPTHGVSAVQDKEAKKRESSMKMEELKELAKMKKEGLITDGEYKKMKKEIID